MTISGLYIRRKEIYNQYLGNLNLVLHGKDNVPEQIVIDAFSASKGNFFVLSNNYLRSSNTKESVLTEMGCKVLETITMSEGYKRYGDKITEVFDYGSLDLSDV